MEATRTHVSTFLTILLMTGLASCGVSADTLYVSKTGGHVLPFDTWAKAATNIQPAVDEASPGDVVLVTNGGGISGLPPADRSKEGARLSGWEAERGEHWVYGVWGWNLQSVPVRVQVPLSRGE
jgi:hypothetical protein